MMKTSEDFSLVQIIIKKYRSLFEKVNGIFS